MALVWEGMQDYIAELKKLPEDCRAEAAKEIEDGVQRAFTAIASVYDAHKFTGTLRSRLKIVKEDGGYALISGSPLAWLFDNGSQARHWLRGSKKSTGRMPATHIFSRTVGFTKRNLTQKFTDMLLRKGAAKVTVDA